MPIHKKTSSKYSVLDCFLFFKISFINEFEINKLLIFDLNFSRNYCKNILFRFLHTFLDECDRVVSTKLLCVKQNAKENKQQLDQAMKDLDDLENMREKVM